MPSPLHRRFRSRAFAAALALGACTPRTAPTTAAPAPATAAPAPTAQQASPVEKFGAPITQAGAQPIAALLANPDVYANKTVVVDGAVRAACQRKGCWMELAEGAGHESQGCRVTFKDYGFFVPTNSAGARARVEGVLAVRTVAPAEVSHLESEGATFAKKGPDGSARELRLVATGVELRR